MKPTNLIQSNGEPHYVVYAYNTLTGKWDAWGQVNSPKDYPDMLERINRGDFFHWLYTGNNNYSKIYYGSIDDDTDNPNKKDIE